MLPEDSAANTALAKAGARPTTHTRPPPRHQEGSRCDAEPGLGVRVHEQVHVVHGRRHGFVRRHGSYRPSSVRSSPSRVGHTLSMPGLHARRLHGSRQPRIQAIAPPTRDGVFCVCGRLPERPTWRAGSRPHARDETSMAAGDTHALGPARRAGLSAGLNAGLGVAHGGRSAASFRRAPAQYARQVSAAWSRLRRCPGFPRP